MKKLIIIASFAALSLQTFAQQEILKNSDIASMVEMGFDEELILSKIETSQSDFNTDINELKKLKDKGLSSKVIAMMMQKTKSNSDMSSTSSGIYIVNSNTKTKILPSVFSGTKTSSFVYELTDGIANAKVKSIINNSTSRQKIETGTPEFHFYFASGDVNNLGNQANNDWWFKSASSPNEFVLVKLKVNKKQNCRELETANSNAFSGNTHGINSRNAIPFKIDIISETEFAVTPEEPLKEGEYCFFYQGVVPQGGVNNQSIFDFSICL